MEAEATVWAARVFTGAGPVEGPGWVKVVDGRIGARGAGERPRQARFCYPRGLLLPGLVDLHAHPGLPPSKFGVNPDTHLLPAGTTAVLAQGEAGADTLDRYLREGVAAWATRVRLALNLSRRGEDGPAGCFECLADLDVAACVAAARRGGAAVWGLAVNTSPASCGATDPREVLRRARAAADAARLPLLVGTRRHADVPLEEQLALLRARDVVTYCYHGGPEGLLQGGRVRECVREARRRGVLFDLGHGATSFSFRVAEGCLADGFPPDTVSTDFYRRHVGAQPPHTLPLTAAKLVAAGMAEAAVLAAITAVPAGVLGLEPAGTLAVGAPADLVVLEPAPGTLADCAGERRAGQAWRAAAVFRAGRLQPAAAGAAAPS